MSVRKKNSYLNISERKILLWGFDILSLLIGVFTVFYFPKVSYINFDHASILTWLITLIVYFMLFGNIFEIYNLKVSSSRYLIFKNIILTCFTTVLFFVFTPRLTPFLPSNRIEIMYLFFGMLIPLCLWRMIYSTYIYSPKFLKNILLIGSNKKVKSLVKIIKKKNFQTNVLHYISDDKISSIPEIDFINISEVDLISIVKKLSVDEIVISTDSLGVKPNSELNKQLVFLFEHGVNIKSIENFYEEITESVARDNLDKEFYKYISFSKNHENKFYLSFIRFIDIVVSIMGLTCLLFYIPFVFIGNLFGSKGPLFYKQVRVGLNGQEFILFKFRSMIVNAEINKAVWAKKNDKRITVFGKFIRMTRIDETPQFWNILIGDMSLIGPRPERPEFVKGLKKELPFYAIRHVIRPGLTGWAQVMYPYANTIVEQEIKLRYDLYYIKSRSPIMDFKILIKTITTVISLKGQ
ncbi:exopolysaccharide biosynthesis polyprenyl glycosylphosphotransferase [Flavicella sp.]|uniref:exopolysaccharide biosynthesis polyprenyl glycosylphosphotransferase n=1 Tax=Flavicella sp. TaxID=2957742 RepID=UPI00301AF6D7